jgi:hypothetical protein
MVMGFSFVVVAGVDISLVVVEAISVVLIFVVTLDGVGALTGGAEDRNSRPKIRAAATNREPRIEPIPKR